MRISQAAFDEIRAKLLAAGYSHALQNSRLDMHGIALVRDQSKLVEIDGCAVYLPRTKE